ncbi:MAG: hypothetical protein NZZ41_05205 [Candidatus Dojkabacteria bacterium]|nr:hypothetical protein [Candidatus Dojkabacteria bacterium]
MINTLIVVSIIIYSQHNSLSDKKVVSRIQEILKKNEIFNNTFEIIIIANVELSVEDDNNLILKDEKEIKLTNTLNTFLSNNKSDEELEFVVDRSIILDKQFIIENINSKNYKFYSYSQKGKLQITTSSKDSINQLYTSLLEKIAKSIYDMYKIENIDKRLNITFEKNTFMLLEILFDYTMNTIESYIISFNSYLPILSINLYQEPKYKMQIQVNQIQIKLDMQNIKTQS